MTGDPIHLLYASHDGQTQKIAERLAARWREAGQAFALFNLAERPADPACWPLEATLVILAPIRYGYPLPPVEAFLQANKIFIKKQRLVMISVNLTARKPDKNTPQTNPYYRKWIKRHDLAPVLGEVLAGKLEYKRYKLWEKAMIRFIMFLTQGPTKSDTVIDYTPWDKVDALAAQIASLGERKEAA